jgi:hypothetical protein
MMPVQTPAGLCDGITDAVETSTMFPHLVEQQSFKGLRTLREARNWSQADAVRAMVACATTEEKRSLPPTDTLLRSWKRWESGKVEPDGGRAEPFYRPIIARIFGTSPETIFPPRREPRTPFITGTADLRDELSSRRDQVRQIIRGLEDELAYLDAVLAVPVPALSR